MEINFHIPDFTNHFHLNMVLINTLAKRPECFREGVRIASIFGNFAGSVWNGGRYLGGTTDDEFVKNIAALINGKGIPLRFTFTNPLLEKQHLGDGFCNRILRICDGGFNEVIVMSPVLEEYIRENYPKYKITSSTCKQIEDIESVNEELKKDYKYVVLDYNFNNRFEELEKIPPEDRSRCEILVNACCTPHCKRRGEHYRQIGRNQIAAWEYKKNELFSSKPFVGEKFTCEFMNNGLYQAKNYPTHVSPEAILEKYLPMGFCNFKIEGRTLPDIYVLEYYVYYMIKPEYQNELRLEMLRLLTGKYRYFMM